MHNWLLLIDTYFVQFAAKPPTSLPAANQQSLLPFSMAHPVHDASRDLFHPPPPVQVAPLPPREPRSMWTRQGMSFDSSYFFTAVNFVKALVKWVENLDIGQEGDNLLQTGIKIEDLLELKLLFNNATRKDPRMSFLCCF
jgi:hypothetical protein